jgi:hypothetical protein
MGGERIPPSIFQLKHEFDGILEAATEARRRARAQLAVAGEVRGWIESLPADAQLEPVKPHLDGHALPDVRSRLADLGQQLRRLETAPVPPPDLRAVIAAKVAELTYKGRPMLSGSDLCYVRWPTSQSANRANADGFARDSCDPLLMFAFLFPQVLEDRLVELIERQASEPVPVRDRPEAIAAIRREADHLRRIECQLIDAGVQSGDGAEVHALGYPDCTLGVRVLLGSAAAAG